MSRKYAILIVEDEPLIAEDIAGCLEDHGFDVAGMASSGELALELLQTVQPDAILLDINLGAGMDGIEVGSIVSEKYRLPFVFLTSHADKGTLERAKHTHPAGYLLKPFDGSALMAALEVTLYNHLNKRHDQNELSLDLVNNVLPTPLSEREFELLELIQQGKTNREIGEALFISVNTVKTHLQNLFEKLDVGNRTQALFRIGELSKSH